MTPDTIFVPLVNPGFHMTLDWNSIILALIAVGGLWISNRAGKRTDQLESKVDEVHVVVNSNYTKAIEEIKALKDVLTSRGIVPPPESK